MKNRLTITNFKKISHEVELVDLTRINYLVGVNGSGKSSILSALYFLNEENAHNAWHFFHSTSKVYFNKYNDEATLVWNEEERGSISYQGNLETRIVHSTGEFSPESGMSNGFDYSNVDSSAFNFINETSSYMGLKGFTVARVIEDNDPWGEIKHKRVFREDDKDVNLAFLSSGLRALDKLRRTILDGLNVVANKMQGHSTIFVLIEEPESNLHPEVQKKIPYLFNEVLSLLPEDIREEVFFFVSTHSPFVIASSIDYDDQKVYPMKDGMMVDLAGEKSSLCLGFSGSECKNLVARMLGADITDFGFPENFCLLEEQSLQRILAKAKSEKIIKDLTFISASGVSRLIKLDDTVNELQNLNLLLKCNPLYVDNYLMIMDNYQEFDKVNREKINKIKEKLGGRFTELSKHGLEDYYFNISLDIHVQAVAEIAAAPKREQGKIKDKYALMIADLIVDSQTFSKLFEGELDFLLR